MKLTVSLTRFSELGQAACSLELDVDDRRSGKLAEKADRQQLQVRIRRAYALVRWAVDDQFARMAAPAQPREPGSDDDRETPAPAPQAPPAEGRGKWYRPPIPPGTPNPPPRTGKQLYAMLRNEEQRYGEGIIRYINQWAKLNDISGRIVDWSGEALAEAHVEVLRKLAEVAEAPADSGGEVRP